MKIKEYIRQLRQCKNNILDIESLIQKNYLIGYFKENALSNQCLVAGTDPIVFGGTPIIVSLTTYGKRLQWVYLTIESLLHQTIKPNKIVLCIAEDNKDNLPELLVKQQKRGLEILFCNDIRSYTKLIPSLKKYPDAAIITVDDDILYPCDFIEYLVKAFRSDSSKIHFYYGHTMGLDNHGIPTSYNEWVKTAAKGCSLYNLPTGVNGILYPPKSLHEEVFNEDVFLKICPTADDLWFRAMSLMKGTLSCRESNVPKG